METTSFSIIFQDPLLQVRSYTMCRGKTKASLVSRLFIFILATLCQVLLEENSIQIEKFDRLSQNWKKIFSNVIERIFFFFFHANKRRHMKIEFEGMANDRTFY